MERELPYVVLTKGTKCLVVAVLAVVALPAPALASAKPKPAALLTVADLPPGYQPADDWNDIVRPGEPDPGICTDPIALGSLVNRPSITSHATFFRRDDGTLLYELLVADGAAKARALVDDVAAAPKKCPRVEDLSLSRMNVPDLGERAAGVLITTGTASPLRTRLIVFAEGGVTAVVMTVGAADAGLRSMHMIALAAARKLTPAN
jgi:hypothetical protein